MFVSEAIRKVKDEKYPERTPREINHGSCFFFAAQVMDAGVDAKLCGGKEKIAEIHKYSPEGQLGRRLEPLWNVIITDETVDKIIEDVGHVWLTDGALHYDAERPDGVANWMDLPHCQRHVDQVGENN